MASRQDALKDYETVKARKIKFYQAFKDGRIIVEPIELTDDRAVFKTTIYKNASEQKDQSPMATGYAYELRNVGFVNKTSWCENCEESSVGRALDNAGFASNKKCSREEIEKAHRMENSIHSREEISTEFRQLYEQLEEKRKLAMLKYFDIENLNDIDKVVFSNAKKVMGAIEKLRGNN